MEDMFGVAFICFGCGSCVYLCFVRWRLQGDGADAAQTSRDLPRGISMAQPGGGREVRQAPRSVRTRGAAAQEAADEGLHVRVEAAHRKLGGGRLRRRACGGAQSAAQRGDGKMRHGTGAGAAAATAAHGEVGGKSGGARWVSGGGGRDASCWARNAPAALQRRHDLALDVRLQLGRQLRRAACRSGHRRLGGRGPEQVGQLLVEVLPHAVLEHRLYHVLEPLAIGAARGRRRLLHRGRRRL
mmetsp:Transcript_43975/g.112309  ORF Transcript_43975/g.112309 Transcript_43975/m.112309 type:complete len:242 (+) Transcript_43975:45-770(+)